MFPPLTKGNQGDFQRTQRPNRHCTLNPTPHTLYPKPQTPNLKPQTPNPKPCTLYPVPCTSHPRTLNPTPHTSNPKPISPGPNRPDRPGDQTHPFRRTRLLGKKPENSYKSSTAQSTKISNSKKT